MRRDRQISLAPNLCRPTEMLLFKESSKEDPSIFREIWRADGYSFLPIRRDNAIPMLRGLGSMEWTLRSGLRKCGLWISEARCLKPARRFMKRHFPLLIKMFEQCAGRRERQKAENFGSGDGARDLKMQQALSALDRFIATPALAKYRLFVWLGARFRPDR